MKNFCPRWDSNRRPPAFAASVLTARPRLPHGRERTTSRLILVLKHLESISPQRHPPDTIWHKEEPAFVEKYFQGVFILASVLFVLYREALVVARLRRLPRMQEVVGSNPTEGKNFFFFSQFTLFYRVECEKLF